MILSQTEVLMTQLLFPPRAVLTAIALLAFAAAPSQGPRAAAQDGGTPAPVSIDDFESYTVGTFPEEWIFVTRDKEIKSYKEAEEPGETIKVMEQDGNQFVRFIIEDEAVRYSRRNGEDFTWNLQKHPRLQWQWRALHLPEGASERDKNDSGAALYVTFGSDWLGRPKSIKYTYSSTLPVGTVVSFGPLKVIVVDSGTAPATGTWKTVQRNVADDYRQVFGGTPPKKPVSITLWSDSDTTHDYAKVDFDDIRLLPPYRR
jgi:hypothetical protein